MLEACVCVRRVVRLTRHVWHGLTRLLRLLLSVVAGVAELRLLASLAAMLRCGSCFGPLPFTFCLLFGLLLKLSLYLCRLGLGGRGSPLVWVEEAEIVISPLDALIARQSTVTFDLSLSGKSEMEVKFDRECIVRLRILIHANLVVCHWYSGGPPTHRHATQDSAALFLFFGRSLLADEGAELSSPPDGLPLLEAAVSTWSIGADGCLSVIFGRWR